MNPIFLTEATIPYDIAARWNQGHGFADSYAWHQRVWNLFPDGPDNERDFLTRLDDLPHGYRLLVLSARPPQRPNWCPENGWRTKSISKDFLSHEIYEFSLVANPTRKVRSNAKGELLKNSRRLAITHREDRCVENKTHPGLLSWLQRQASRHGFELPNLEEVQTVPRPRKYFIKKGISGVHAATEFRGVLRVTDPELFHQTFFKGLGSARAFGFGLLCLVPR